MNMLDRNSTGPNRFKERQDKARTHQRPLDEHNIGNLKPDSLKKVVLHVQTAIAGYLI